MVSEKKFFIAMISVVILLIVTVLLALTIGASTVGIGDILDLIFDYKNTSEVVKQVVLKIRAPRIVAAIIAGATLAASGVLIKAVMKNPLADTGLLGIQSGASVLAMLIILVFPAFLPFLPIAAFLGGLVAYIILISLSYKNGINPLRLVLAGVAVNALFGSIIGFITIFNSDKLQSALSWLNGSFASVTVTDMKILLIYGIIALIIAIFTIPKCNLLSLDDAMIVNLGENLNFARFVIATIAVLLASISVAIVGIIGFIGLIVPHIARMIVGTNHKFMLPFSIVLGSVFVLLADTIQKVIFAPYEVPVGILISLIGAPFFLFLLRKQKL